MGTLEPNDWSSRISQVRRVGAAFLRIRAALVAPAMLILASALWFSGEPRFRTTAIVVCLSVMLAFFVGEALVFRRRDISERYLLGSMLVTQLGIASVAASSGGIASPVVPLMLAPTGVGLAAFGSSSSGRTVLLGLVVSLLASALVAGWLAWPPLASPLREVMTFVASVMCGVLLYVAIGRLSDAYVSAGAALARTQSSLLLEARLRARDLEAVGARVAHELKNPLTAAKGLIELVRKHSDARQGERIDVALLELGRIQATLADYLAFSRPLAPLEVTTFDVRAWLSDLVAAHEGLARGRGVRLRLEFTNDAKDDSETWRGDRARLGDAVANLLSNAIYACGEGDRVDVVGRLGSDQLQLEVQDGGVGLDADALLRLGTPFVSTREGGTGLGVVLARGTIVQHAGRLRYESRKGEGTRALVELPRMSSLEGLVP